MKSVKDGDLRKSAILFERYNVPIYNYFLRRNHKVSTAEDLLQIVFERVIKYRQSYETNCNFRTWLYSIARNVGISEYNKMNSIVMLSLDDRDVGHTSVAGDYENRDVLSRGLAAVEVLGHYVHLEGIRTTLIRALSTERDVGVRIGIIQAISAIPKDGTIEILEKIVDDKEIETFIRDEASMQLVHIKEI